VPIAADGDVGIGPVLADMTHQAPDVAGTFGTRRRLASAQQHRHRPPARGIVHMDRQEAALTVMSVPERELLIAVHDITRVIDIQRHRRRWGRIAGTVNADHRDHHPGQFTRGRCILPAAHRRLAGQPRARSRQLAQRQAEARIVAQGIEIIGVLIATRDREHTGTQNVIEAMDHPRRVTRIGDARSKLPADPHRALGLRQQQNAAVRGQPATVERGCDLLAANRWKRKSRCAIIAPGGCGPWHKLPR
jgi:hypothetical protein